MPQRITIRLGGVIVADTSRGLRVLETHHAPTYYPAALRYPRHTAPGARQQLLRMEGCRTRFRRDGGVC
ncbi:DUF427 domain-containing protein [Devosia psychrophila]|uniref:DUF427 domain-containing protein n=1 Tax=Devosia psychrophila TaxID=728005 RepID=UPI0018F7A0DC